VHQLYGILMPAFRTGDPGFCDALLDLDLCGPLLLPCDDQGVVQRFLPISSPPCMLHSLILRGAVHSGADPSGAEGFLGYTAGRAVALDGIEPATTSRFSSPSRVTTHGLARNAFASTSSARPVSACSQSATRWV
jgi:hypothetical protein